MRRKLSVFIILLFSMLLAGSGLLILSALPRGEAVSGNAAAREPAVAPLYPRYELSIDLAVDARRARVREKMSVVNTTGNVLKRIVFSVPPAVNNQLFALDWITVTSGNTTMPVDAVFEGSMMSIALPRPVSPEAPVSVTISFTLSPLRLGGHEIHPQGNLGYDDEVMQFGDCFPVITPYDPDTGFRTWAYVPVGDPYVYLVSDYMVSINTDLPVLIAAAGLVTHQENSWRFSLEKVRSFAFTASKEYDFLSGNAGGIPLYCYYVKGYEQAAEVIIKTAAACLEVYSRFFGPYPYPELVLAQNAYASAMEYSGFVSLSNAYIRGYTDEAPELVLFITAHEIAHQWWYGAVGSDQVKEPWLDEMMAKFSEFFFFRKYHPAYLAWWQSLLNVQWPRGHYIDDPILSYRAAPRDYTRMIYGVAPRFIQELYNLIGEREFLAFMQDYYTFGKGRFVTGKDFFMILGKHTRADITPLLKKYFRNPP